MITVSSTTALLAYLGFFLLLCFWGWCSFHFRERKKATHTPLYRLDRCEYCTFSYLTSADKPISRCPQCNSFNKLP